MNKYKKFALRGLIIGAFLALFAMFGGFINNSKPLTAAGVRDCDTNAVINCGALTVTELQQKYAATTDVHALYNAFGISSAGVQSLSTQVALGEVHKDGTVWLKNGAQIGSGAITAGRWNMAGSTAIAGTPFFSRPPSVSFAANSIDAFIGFENGKPAWAILSACGNPVKWNRPQITITKQVAKQDLSGWVKDTVVTNNSDVEYFLTIKNTGNASDTNVRFIDQLPANQTYVANSTKINGVTNVDGVTSSGLNLGTLTAGQTVFVTLHARVIVPTTKCGTTDMINYAREDSDKSASTEDSATTHTTIVCQTVKCNSLTGPDAMIVGDTATFTANASDASLVAGYNFTVNNNPVTANGNVLTLKLTQAGTYTIKATVTPKAGVTDGGSAACVKTVTVKDKLVVSCNGITGPDAMIVGDTATFTANASDATLVASYNFTVNNNPVTANGNVLTLQLTQAGTYTVKATITPIAGVTNGGSTACVKTVTVNQKPMVKCDALNGPTSANIGDTVTYTIVPSDASLVASYSFTINGAAVTSTGNTLSHKVTSAGDFSVAGKVTPKAGVTDGGSTSCVKNLHVNDIPQIITTCDALNASKSALLVGETTTLTATATATNTTVTEYIFKVNGQVVQSGSTKNTFNFTPTAKGTYNVSVSVKFANGAVKGDDAACSKTITVTEQVIPIYSCDAFSVTPSTVVLGGKVTVNVKYTAANGATFNGAVVDFGEAKVNVAASQTANGSISADYTYKVAKDYTINVTLSFMVNGVAQEVSGAHCTGKVTVTPKTPMCTIHGKETSPANDKNCAEVLTKVTELPNTGAGNVIGLFASLTVAGAFMHNYFARRAANRQ